MAGNILLKADAPVGIVINVVSQASNVAVNSSYISNTSNNYIDAQVAGHLQTGGTAPGASGYVNVYAYGCINSTHSTVIYTEGITGGEATIALTSPTNLRLIGVISTPTSAVDYKFGPFSVANAFGGVMPERWGIVIENKTAATFSSTAADSTFFYRGVYAQYT